MSTSTIHREKLTAKQRLFVALYPKSMNATTAAMEAGYSKKTAHVIGHELLNKPEIAQALAIVEEKHVTKAGLAVENVLRELMNNAFSNLADAFNPETGELLHIKDMPESMQRAIASIEIQEGSIGDGEVRTTKIKLWDKNAALEKLAKHLGLLKDAPQVQINNFVVRLPEKAKTVEEWEEQAARALPHSPPKDI